MKERKTKFIAEIRSNAGGRFRGSSARDLAAQERNRLGEEERRVGNGYGMRRKAKSVFSDYKRMFGDNVGAGKTRYMVAEINRKISVVDIFLSFPEERLSSFFTHEQVSESICIKSMRIREEPTNHKSYNRLQSLLYMHEDSGIPFESRMEPLEWAKFIVKTRSERNYSTAFSVLSVSANKGSSDAEFYLGLLYSRGQGVRKDLSAAIYWFERASRDGNLGAMYFLGKMYSKGYGTERNVQKAISFLNTPAKMGDPRAQYELGLIYFDGNGTEKDLPAAAEWFTAAAESGHSEAQFILGQLYKTGYGVEQSTEKALNWLTSAAMNKHRGAQILLGNMYDTGDGVPVDKEEAGRWYSMKNGEVISAL